MKKNIIFMYIIYILIICLLFIIDNVMLMYYIFWFNNIFIYPLIWLWIKILYYNRTILLLLLFYYLIAKYTIKEPGYKYFSFFNIDIKKVQAIYWNYLWSITVYHIEILSIFLFFFVIIMPLVVHSKELFFSISCILVFFFSLFKLFKNRFKYIKEKKIRLRSLIFFSFIFFIFIKYFNYQYIKDLYTMYIYLDKWAFELLEWKLQMYNKLMERDYYSETVGLKPKWVGDKFNKKEVIDHKYWDYLCKKKKNKFVNELKYKLKRTKRKYYLYTKYYERVVNVKNEQSYNKLEILRKEMLLKKFLIFKNLINEVNIKEYTPKVNTKNENPVVTMEKEKERTLHRTVITNIIQKFSINNYYRLNLLLKNLTLNQLYYQPYIDKKGLQKQILEQKKETVYLNMKDRLNFKDDVSFLKKIVLKMKIYERTLKNKNFNNDISKSQFYYKKKDFIEKFFSYLFLEKEVKNKSKFLLKNFNKNEIKFSKKKDKLSVRKFLINMKDVIKIKTKTNRLSFFSDSKKNILNNDKLEYIKKKRPYSFPTYVEKSSLEKTDNQLLYNTVKKYNEEKTKIGWKHEFSEFFVLKEKKESSIANASPDLSRRK